MTNEDIIKRLIDALKYGKGPIQTLFFGPNGWPIELDNRYWRLLPMRLYKIFCAEIMERDDMVIVEQRNNANVEILKIRII